MRKQLTKIALAVSIMLAMVFTFSCSDDKDDNSPSTSGGGGNAVYGPSVSYGGKTYKTVIIGNQTWMAENLNYDVEGSKCYGEDGREYVGEDDDGNKIYKTLSNAEIQDNCQKYGRLYDWVTAKSICPEGWHTPSNDEWNTLFEAVGGSSVAGRKLKTQNGWNEGGNGTDEFGFSAMPGGRRSTEGLFGWIGLVGYWWSSNDHDSNVWCMSYDNTCVTKSNTRQPMDSLFSVRCLKD